MTRHEVKVDFIYNVDHHGQRTGKLYFCTVCKERLVKYMDGKYRHAE